MFCRKRYLKWYAIVTCLISIVTHRSHMPHTDLICPTQISYAPHRSNMPHIQSVSTTKSTQRYRCPRLITGRRSNAAVPDSLQEEGAMPLSQTHYRKKEQCRCPRLITGRRSNAAVPDSFHEIGAMPLSQTHYRKKEQCR